MTHGSRNLITLGIGALAFAGITTSVSLAIYKASGDIYLDRSRPGYLPDEVEVTEEKQDDTNFVFSDSGTLTTQDLDDYLEALKTINERLNNYPDAYAPAPLSDESLGIPSEFAEDADSPVQILN